MWANTQETARYVTFTEEFLNETFIFCVVAEADIKVSWYCPILLNFFILSHLSFPEL